MMHRIFRVAVSRSQDVPDFGPPIPPDSVFKSNKAFRDFLLSKGRQTPSCFCIVNPKHVICLSFKFRADSFLFPACRAAPALGCRMAFFFFFF